MSESIWPTEFSTPEGVNAYYDIKEIEVRKEFVKQRDDLERRLLQDIKRLGILRQSALRPFVDAP